MVYELDPDFSLLELGTLRGATTTTRVETTMTLGIGGPHIPSQSLTTSSLSGTLPAISSASESGSARSSSVSTAVSAPQTSPPSSSPHATGTASFSPSASASASPANSKPNAARAVLIGGILAASLVLGSITLAVFLWRRHRRIQAARVLDELMVRPSSRLRAVDAADRGRFGVNEKAGVPPVNGRYTIDSAPEIQLRSSHIDPWASAIEAQPVTDDHERVFSDSSSGAEPKPIGHCQFRALVQRMEELELEARVQETEMELPPDYSST
uniref:Uncharacterized protein n=1 Tax=Mycena chlorophos TaxID=658473 RepID=A0ABQ0LQ38_MYCCL|nr:predicted protein [Mycena chlorophos]